MDLQFLGLGEKLQELSEILANQIGDYEGQGFVIEKASGSASLRRKSTPIDFDKSFESQQELISEQVEWIHRLYSIAAKLNIEEIESLYS